ncbi:ATP-binding protein [Ilumatobacter nonamiensis]|uniref:ATP-binding protein n=1 Tax=Ilumatobacter nonamiensis TaxID=467093 RepID=UPI00034798E6|nr:LuxR family transcriptional regulator [Ilumatobacter nonamiensis]
MQGTGTELVGREKQLDAVADVLDSGGTALIDGEAGAGKSALIGAALGDLPTGIRVWRGQCEPLAVPAPFTALFEMLPVLPESLADAVRSGVDVIGVYSSMLAEMRRRPTVLVLDDLQWADAATAGLARYIGRRIDGTPSTMVCAFRREELDADGDFADVLAELGRTSIRIDLPPLTRRSVGILAGRLAPDRVGEVDEIHRTTGGNPLFVVEALRTSVDVLPRTVGDLAVARVRRLPTAVQQLVESVALCPDGVTLDAALALSVDSGDHIDRACERELLTVGRDRVSCRHDLLRSAIEDSIPPVKRRQLHRRLFEVLEPIAADHRDVAHLAYHAAEARLDEPAVEYSLAAATTATAAGGHREAAEHYLRALGFSEVMPPAVLDRTRRRAFDELLLLGRLDDAERLIDERSATATEEVHGDIVVQRFEVAALRDRCPEAAPLAREVLDRHPATGSSARVPAIRLLAGVAWGEGRHDDAVELLEGLLDEVVAIGDRASEARIRASLGSALQSDVDAEQAGTTMLEAGRDLALEVGADGHAAFAFNNLLAHDVWRYDLRSARERCAAALDFTHARQLDSFTNVMHSSAAVTALHAGEWDSALEHTALSIGPDPVTCADEEVAYVHAAIGLRRDEPVTEDVRAILSGGFADGTMYFAAVAAAELAMEAAWCDQFDLDEARSSRDALLDGLAVQNDDWARAHLGFWSMRCFGEPGVADAPGPVGREIGGDLPGAADDWDRRGMPFHAALVRADLADPPVVDVESALTALGAMGSLRAVRRRWAERGVVVPDENAHPSGLTDRQLEVLALVAAKCTNAEIAEKLFISTKTAGHHVSAILTRLDVPTRWAAAAIAEEQGWVGAPAG